MKKPPARRAPSDQDAGQDQSAVVTAQWSGPLPPPSILADFDQVVENGAERIFSAWERETTHRHELEKRDLRIAGIDAILGKVFAFLFVTMALGLCGFAVLKGSTVLAAILGGGVITSVVWAFVKVNNPRKE